MRKVLLVKTLFLFALIIFQVINNSYSLKANNLEVTNLTVDQTNQTVTFDVSWDNSWYVTDAPKNWDAVWLFVKFRECDFPTDPLVHGELSATKSDHSFPDLDAMTSVDWDGSSGTTESVIQGATLDYTDGIMLRKDSPTGVGTTSSTVTLNITNMPGPAIDIEVKVFGIEMVYIPKGDFYVGDGDGTGNGSTYRFLSSADNNALPMQVTEAYETAASEWYYQVGTTTISGVPAAWPKGNYGFYIMKYEITQGIYAEFLNTMSAGQASSRYPGNYNSNRNRLTVGVGNAYLSDRPDRAQNYLGWEDISAFLDWACLRPMTETEYEKACRGLSSPFTEEYPWGNTNISTGYTFTAPAYEDGSETLTEGNCTYANGAYSNGDGGRGPRRVGIFATSTSTREQSGGSYYGVMDLAGNVNEMLIGMVRTAADNVFTRTWGDGNLIVPSGNADVSTWPSPSFSFSTGYNNLVVTRGGNYYNSTSYLTVSGRYHTYRSNYGGGIHRHAYNGGRGAR